MTNSLQVALVQPDLQWLAPEANLDHLSQLLSDVDENVGLVVLPEMFTSGFTEMPESLYGNQTTIAWMQEQAQRLNAAIAGSVACELGVSHSDATSSVYANRLLLVTPEGVVHQYDKCHLFQMGGEHKRYRAGRQRCVVEYKGWRLLLTVCYDLRFPVFCRNRNDYDAMICVANWPKARRHAWRTLLQARAIENQAYVLGVNRIGQDGKGLVYSGDSMVVDFLGMPLADGGDGREAILAATLNKSGLLEAREAFPVSNDADSFTLLL